MASKLPVVKQTKYSYVLLSSILLIIISYGIFLLMGISFPIEESLIVYLVISYTGKAILPKNHKKGLNYIKNNQYDDAIVEFHESYVFFSKYKWVDKYRHIVMLSTSQFSYIEMALVNMAYCYGQIGQIEKAKELYQQVLNEFPDNQIAIAALKIFDSADGIDFDELQYMDK
ncbi:tetratricopeptide repeat protein [Anaerocolumna sp. MB42-C2]|uniref:tetratricopeptide repeat protein n=1 Tax=Anaerocolumna sp. MB42-C2 TaxID=3070997 RepID=UPI0027DFA31F|nr:tetratricopeptide repeat protein [Anaerocolumna sp. MB42-C2]WMJ87662.1 tetratricopeptide repeat protein [Anaerocolumna sp. MB42-C2]